MQKQLEPLNLEVTNGHENGYEWIPGNLFEITNSVVKFLIYYSNFQFYFSHLNQEFMKLD